MLFTTAVHGVEIVLWSDIPEQFGWIEPASWYVIALPLIAGGIVALCLRLPGRAGHPASEGIGLHPATPVELPSILLAALASLSFGLVLGPEAPLMALGLCFGGVAAQFARAEKEHAKDLVLAGGFAAIAVVLGGPIVAAFMIFEMVASSGAVPAHEIGHVLLPGFVASGTGYLVFVGLGRWHGLDVPELAGAGTPAADRSRSPTRLDGLTFGRRHRGRRPLETARAGLIARLRCGAAIDAARGRCRGRTDGVPATRSPTGRSTSCSSPGQRRSRR